MVSFGGIKLRYGNESDTSETYCYVRIEPLLNEFYDTRTILSMKNNPPPWFIENLFGIHEVFKNKHGNLQIKSGILEIIGCSQWTKKKNKVRYLYNGGFVTGGIIREWSKKPIKYKVNKVDEYKKIQNEINELKQKQQLLLTK